MKLIRCNCCNDVVRLIHTKWRTCECGESGGQYNKDLITATVGGNCIAFGISNLFFNDEFLAMTEEEKVGYRKKIGHHFCEIWHGENRGDGQIHRIASPEGPRLEMDVTWEDKDYTRSTFTDDREYHINLKEDTKPSFVISGNKMEPSFKDRGSRDPLKRICPYCKHVIPSSTRENKYHSCRNCNKEWPMNDPEYDHRIKNIKWIKIGSTRQDKYPTDHTKEVEFAVIKNDRLKRLWVGRNTIVVDENSRKVRPTHWRYI